MELNLNGKYHSVYKKYSKEIISYFCNGVPPKEICKNLHDEFGVEITYQGINFFYCNNKEVIDDCIKTKKEEDLDKVKASNVLDFLKSIGKEMLYCLSLDLADKIKTLPSDQQIKLIPTIMNSLAKCEGMDKSELTLNNIPTFEELFDDDLIEDALNDFDSTE